MKTLISIDPGMSTGIAVGTYSDTEPFELVHVSQIEGGIEGFRDNFKFYYESYCHHLQIGKGRESFRRSRPPGGFDVIVEKFNARGGANAGFSYRTKDLEPLRIEGALIMQRVPFTWASPPQQYFSGGEGKAKKKQAQHRWLKEKGLYVTGKMVGCDNADDVRSAIAHAIAYLVRQKHRPTIEHYFPREGKNA